MRPKSDPPKMKNPTPDKIVAKKKSIKKKEKKNLGEKKKSAEKKKSRQKKKKKISAKKKKIAKKNHGGKKKKNNEANWMVSNSTKLDCRTKQHTQFGVSASNGSRDMARTKSWQKKRKKKK